MLQQCERRLGQAGSASHFLPGLSVPSTGFKRRFGATDRTLVPCGSRVMTASADGTARDWNVEIGSGCNQDRRGTVRSRLMMR